MIQGYSLDTVPAQSGSDADLQERTAACRKELVQSAAPKAVWAERLAAHTENPTCLCIFNAGTQFQALPSLRCGTRSESGSGQAMALPVINNVDMIGRSTMRVVTYNPWSPLASSRGRTNRYYLRHPMNRLYEDINRLFDDSLQQLDDASSETGDTFDFSPSFDVEQDDDRYELSLEIPGMKREDVVVETREDMLVISGTKNKPAKSAQSENRENVRSSRQFGRFMQSLSLPEDADKDGIEANFADGVLTVTIPRDKEKARDHTRRIEVREASSNEIESDSKGQEALMQPDTQDEAQSQGSQRQQEKTAQEDQERSQQSEPA